MLDNITYKKINGVKCCIINKKDFVEKQAMVAFNFGSINTEVFLNGQIKKLNSGIAHFLEHKLFEEKDRNIFDEFNKLGATVNAFTNFCTTAYYFSCIDNFDKSFKLLLEFVSSPYFTDENVQKEKGIITQEIKMYDDNPYWRGYFNLLCGMFGKDSPLSKDIAGSYQDILNIDKEQLYFCYENFYTKDNSIIICCGDFESEDEIFEIIIKNIRLIDKKQANLPKFKDNWNIMQNYVEKKMNIQQNIFNIGFKDELNNDKIEKNIISSKIMLDIVFGNSSKFYADLYSKGIIDNSFSFTYNSYSNILFYVFSGNSNNSKILLEYLLDEIKKFKEIGIKEDDFLRIKNKNIGKFKMKFNYINSLISMEAELFSKDLTLLDYYNAYKNVTFDEVDLKLKKFNLNDYSLSIIS